MNAYMIHVSVYTKYMYIITCTCTWYNRVSYIRYTSTCITIYTVHVHLHVHVHVACHLVSTTLAKEGPTCNW